MGVVEAFRQHAQIVEVSKAGGSSAGALVAAAMLTGLPTELVIVQVVEMTDRAFDLCCTVREDDGRSWKAQIWCP